MICVVSHMGGRCHVPHFLKVVDIICIDPYTFSHVLTLMPSLAISGDMCESGEGDIMGHNGP